MVKIIQLADTVKAQDDQEASNGKYSVLAMITGIAISVLLYGMELYEALFFLLFITFLLGVFPIFRKYPTLIVPMLLFAMPLEISKSWIPVLQITSGREGNVSVLDLSRITIIISGLFWLIYDLKNRKMEIMWNGTIKALLLFLSYTLFSTFIIANGSTRSIIEVTRYMSYFVMLLLTIRFIEKREDLDKIFRIMIILGAILSVIGIFEYATKIHLWNQSIGVRTNTVFADPNIFGRFLAMVLVITIYKRLRNLAENEKYYDVLTGIAFLALVFSISRGGIIAFIAGMAFIFFTGNVHIKRVLLTFGIVLSLILAFIYSDMVSSRGGNLEVSDIGQRTALIITGLTMFIEHPVFGVGLGGFQEVATTLYENLLPWGGRGVTLSHTAVITIMAEMGIVGALLFLNVLVQLVRNYRKIKTIKSEIYNDYSKMSFAILLVILVSAQSAGRMFEDPFLWFMIGVQIAILKLGKELKSVENDL